jgi:rod shape-determining protein MreC
VAIRQRSRSARLVVVTLVAASLAIITVDYRAGEEGPLEAAGRATSSAIAPLQRAVSSVVQPISDLFSSLSELPSLADENRELREQVEDLKAALQLNQELSQQIATLEGLLDLRGQLQRPILARVIGSGVSNFEWTITIDRGSDDGVEVDMPVVTGDAAAARLVGRVVQVTPVSSMVQLLIDRDFAVAGKLATSQEAGLVMGRGEEDLRMGHLRPGIEVSETEPESVFTVGYEVNGQPGLYPAGILIGTVSRAFSEPDAAESFVTIRPAVDFATLQHVFVIVRGRAERGATP